MPHDSQPSKDKEGDTAEPAPAVPKVRRPSSRMPRNSLFFERIVPLLLIVLLVGVAALILFIVWGVLTGTYA